MQGIIAGLAIKTAHEIPLTETDHVQVEANGITGNVRQGARRRVTLLSREQWAEVQSELGVELPWITRRANVLVEGIVLSESIGKILRINDVVLQVHGETEPCEEMDKRHPGLLAALLPECRGGVHASVVQGGTIRVGDEVAVGA